MLTLGEDTNLPPRLCPYCGYMFDAAAPLSDDPQAKPQPGLLAICAGCCRYLRFDADLALQKIPPGELAVLLVTYPVMAARLKLLEAALRFAKSGRNRAARRRERVH